MRLPDHLIVTRQRVAPDGSVEVTFILDERAFFTGAEGQRMIRKAAAAEGYDVDDPEVDAYIADWCAKRAAAMPEIPRPQPNDNR